MKIKLLFSKRAYQNFVTALTSRNSGIFFMLLATILGCKSIEAPTDRKIISNTNFKEILYVTAKTPETKLNRRYYWYKSQEVHSSVNSYSGQLLDLNNFQFDKSHRFYHRYHS